jgi:hypothetical protein
MTARAYGKIPEGLKEALAIARGEASPARVTVVRVPRKRKAKAPRKKPDRTSHHRG